MKFLILLIALGIERYLNISDKLHRFNWFHRYLSFESKYLLDKNLWRGFLGVALVALPVLFVVAIVYYLFAHALFGFVGFVLALFIFVYSLGPKDLYAQLERYFAYAAHETTDLKAQQSVQSLIIDEHNGAAFQRQLSRGMLWHFNQRIFAVSFWFVVLGPLGALLYRMISLLNEVASNPASKEKEMAEAVHTTLNILDWIPTRLASLGYALMGNFMKGFAYWMKHCISGIDKNKEIAIGSGFAALEIDSHHEADVEENKSVLGLLDRTLIMYLILVAVFTLGALAY